MPVTIGIIYPPPDVRSIVDKTATFVARNGPEFEEKIRQNELNNPKFNFLNPNDPYHAYYSHKVKEIEEGKGQEPLASTTSTTSSVAQLTSVGSSQSLQTNLQKLSISAKTQDAQSRIIEQIIIPKEPPPDYEFTIDAPSLSLLDVDVIKLTAQFVARNGAQFRNNLMNKEQRNPMFDFLKPQHSHFSYFTRLVEQYTKILMPPKDLLDKLKKEVENPYSVLRDVAYRVEWEKIQQREKAKVDELAEKERVAYAQVDWHDFVVVETVDYQPNETGNFPPPTTPIDVGARTIAMERIETGNMDGNVIDINGRLLMDRIIIDEARVEINSLSTTQVEIAPPVSSADKNIEQVAMDEESDEEEEEEKQKQKTQKSKEEANKTLPMSKKDLPLPPNPDNVIIRKDYDPKSKHQQQPVVKSGETYFKSPFTGELIPSSSMSEHMRIAMFDPRWLEQKQKERKEREEQEEVLATGVSIEKNLKRMAEYRSDLFGSGAEEVIIGKKLGEEEKKKEEIIAWDGHTNTVEKTTKRAMSGITIEDQIKAIHQTQGLIEDESNTVKIGPAIPKLPSAVPTKPPLPQQQTIMVSNYKILNVPVGVGVVKPNLTSIQPPSLPTTSLQQQQMQAQQTNMGTLPPPPSQPEPSEEPSAKRQKTEEQLVPEAEFLAQHAQNGPVTFTVQVPNVAEKPEWKLNGQNIQISMPLTDSVASIKNKLMDLLGIPNAKQKLQLEGMFIKDQNTLAFYNFSPESIVNLQLKERGGRKK